MSDRYIKYHDQKISISCIQNNVSKRKIYVGKDIGKGGHTIRYFGCRDISREEVDLTKDELQDFSIRREIIFEGDDRQEVGRKEMALIVDLGSNINQSSAAIEH